MRLRRRGQQQIEHALFRVKLGFIGHVFQFFLAHHVNGDLYQVADHGFHVAAHVADFGELRRFHFHKRRVGQLGQAARDLGLAHASGADHDDVLGNDLFRQVGREFLPAHAIAQRHRHRALGCRLADDVLIQLGHDLPRRQFVEPELLLLGGLGQINRHYNSSTVRFLLVKMQISPAMRMASSAILREGSSVFS